MSQCHCCAFPVYGTTWVHARQTKGQVFWILHPMANCAQDLKAIFAVIISSETATVGLSYSESVDEQPSSLAPFKIVALKLLHTNE